MMIQKLFLEQTAKIKPQYMRLKMNYQKIKVDHLNIVVSIFSPAFYFGSF